jgi:predicted CoA-substrate-specific enzyme activase
VGLHWHLEVKEKMGCVLGIDIGSALTKGIIISDQEVLGSFVLPSGGDYRLTAEQGKQELLSKTGLLSKDIVYTVATGAGAKMVAFADAVKTDMSCHARGVSMLYPSVRTAVDVGDLYSRAFRIDERGNLAKFLLSSKCAGGSARILKVIAKVLQVKVEDLGPLSLRSGKKVDFSTGCAVFAESEAISWIAEGVAKEDLVAAIHRALAAQLSSLVERVGLKEDFALVGGGARDEGLVKAMEEMRHINIVVPPEPDLTAALGAAIIAEEA